MVTKPTTDVLSVIGLGKLGSPLLACLASKGFLTIGVDVNPEVVSAVLNGKAPVFEPGLDTLLAENGENISATTDIRTAVVDSSITFIIVPTPSDESGGFSLRFIQPTCSAVGEALRSLDRYHLVVLTSTVLPGSTAGAVREMLETNSRKVCGKDFGLCYSPEFIALGSVIRDMLNPDFVLIGESDKRAGEQLEGIYKRLCDNNPPIVHMSLVNAEVTKLAVNTYVTTKISFANMLARICENLPGADVDVVTEALGKDKRIGSKYLKGAVGYGGPCFPRDNQALSFVAREIGLTATLAEATDALNREQVPYLVRLIMKYIPDGGRVGILGLTYKPDTNVTEESQGVLLAEELRKEGIPVSVYDPGALLNDLIKEFKGYHSSASLEECIAASDVIVITTPWEEFKNLDPGLLERKGSKRVIIDCWRILNPESISRYAEYRALGIGYQSDKL